MLKKISEAVTPINLGTATAPPSQPNASVPNTPQQNQEISAIKNKVEKAVSESGDLISALECVGAMYGIPATNIIADDTATGIRVVNDNIIAPPLEKANGRTRPIMCAIGSVLDYISQRIDDKLNDYQSQNIQQGRIQNSLSHANPNKGKVIERYEDDEGGEILAYNTGLVDMPNTPAGRAKVAELRASKAIPEFDPSQNPMSTTPTYFSEDEDDISSGVDMNAGSDQTAGTVDIEPTDVAEEIQESAYHLRMISKLNNTTHLGYDLLRKHGFDYVKPVDSIVMESDNIKDDKDDNDKKKKIRVEDIKYMKFDNTEIIKAIEYFNKARGDQDNVRNGKMDLNKFINNPNYEKAINCLNKQFDCRINLRFFETKKGKYENTGTAIYNDLKKKMTISKSKGFQLGGLPIDIETYNHYFENNSPKDIELFGQTLVSTICHEIFHNISYVMRNENAKMGMSLAMTLDVASNVSSMKERRIIITNYVDSIEELGGNKVINKLAKKKLIKQLMTLSTVQNNEPLVIDMQKSVGKDAESSDRYIDNLIKKYKKEIKKVKPSAKKYILPVVATGASILAATLAPGSIMFTSAIYGFGTIMGIYTLGNAAADATLLSVKKVYDKSNLYEEYYCDLFSAMYKLPKFFFVGPSKKKYVTNDFNDEKVNELAKLEKEYYEAIFASYPTDMERTHAGVKIAKQLLEEKDLDPAIKKYCTWIVDNFSNIEKSDIKEIYNKTTFDPKEADDLDKHLQDLITDNNLVLTESFKQWLMDSTIMNE